MSATLALAGQPNCGKSTLFNALAGFRANTGNFPGTSVAYTEGKTTVAGETLGLIDLPGLYALSAQDAAERVAQDYLLAGRADGLVLVLDATLLARGLSLAVDLLALGLPAIVAVNLVDEAKRRGIELDLPALEKALGVPVIPCVATRGQGVKDVARRALETLHARRAPQPIALSAEMESLLDEVARRVPEAASRALRSTPRFIAMRLLDGDESLRVALGESAPEAVAEAIAIRARTHTPSLSERMMTERHSAARALANAVIRKVPPSGSTTNNRLKLSRRERLDAWFLHPVVGPVIALCAFAALFVAAFVAGDALAGIIAKPFDAVAKELGPRAGTSVWWALTKGAWDGVAGGAGIVLPYLFPLVLLLSLYEDIGYLPRAAFLIDGLMSRIGLHGKSVVPLVLGYGCNVPALVGTRILESPRDRLLTALLVPLVPCSARTVVILALVGATLGAGWALALYFFNLLIVGLAGRLLSTAAKKKIGPKGLGIVMEMPPLRFPPVRAVLRKVWFRSYEFLAVAWPVLLAASVVLALIEYAGINAHINNALSPLTVSLLGLPVAVGVTLFFGVLRKELTLALLGAALGTEKFASVMSEGQLVVFTLFVMFYVPCVSTVATMVREIGWRWATASVVGQTALALLIAGVARLALL